MMMERFSFNPDDYDSDEEENLDDNNMQINRLGPTSTSTKKDVDKSSGSSQPQPQTKMFKKDKSFPVQIQQQSNRKKPDQKFYDSESNESLPRPSSSSSSSSRNRVVVSDIISSSTFSSSAAVPGPTTTSPNPTRRQNRSPHNVLSSRKQYSSSHEIPPRFMKIREEDRRRQLEQQQKQQNTNPSRHSPPTISPSSRPPPPPPLQNQMENLRITITSNELIKPHTILNRSKREKVQPTHYSFNEPGTRRVNSEPKTQQQQQRKVQSTSRSIVTTTTNNNNNNNNNNLNTLPNKQVKSSPIVMYYGTGSTPTTTTTEVVSNNPSGGSSGSSGLLFVSKATIDSSSSSIKLQQQPIVSEKRQPITKSSGSVVGGGSGGGLFRLNNDSKKLLKHLVNETVSDRSRPKTNLGQHSSNVNHELMTSSSLDPIQKLSKQLAQLVTFAIESESLDHRETSISTLRLRLLCQYETSLLNSDLCFGNHSLTLQTLWQSCFYPFIDFYRKNYRLELNQPSNNSNGGGGGGQPMVDSLRDITESGQCFFENLLDKLLGRYGLNGVNGLIERGKHFHFDRTAHIRLCALALLESKMLVCLGDLARYRELACAKPNFASSKQFYARAHTLMPNSGHPLSQLSLVTYYQKNFFESVYYYIRFYENDSGSGPQQQQPQQQQQMQPATTNLFAELTPSSSPSHHHHHRSSIHQSTPKSNKSQNKQNLTLIFSEVKDCFERNLVPLKADFEQMLQQERVKEAKIAAGHSRINQYYRNEYWVRPDQTIAKCDQYNFFDLAAVKQERCNFVDFYKEKTLPALSFEQLLANFELSFLMVHGMLNCRISLDNFFHVAKQMLLEFDKILSYDFNGSNLVPRTALSIRRLMQLLVINMFTVKNTASEEDIVNNAAQYSFPHQNGYSVMAAMVIKVLEKLIQLIPSFVHKLTEFTGSGATAAAAASSQSKEPVFDLDQFGYLVDPNYLKMVDQNWLLFDTLLAFVKIWSDWFRRVNPRFPPLEMDDLSTGNPQNIWQVLARFLGLLRQVSITGVRLCDKSICTHSPDQCKPVQLPEDRCLDGFKLTNQYGFDSWKLICSNGSIGLPIEMVHTCLRIGQLQHFGQLLCSLQPQPYLSFDSQTMSYSSLIDIDDVEGCPGLKLKTVQQRQFDEALSHYLALNKSLGRYELVDEDEDDEDVEDNSENGSENQGSERSDDTMDDDFGYEDEQEALDDLNQLNIDPAERRKLLRYRTLRKQNSKHGRYFKLMEHLNEPKRRFIICPRYVVFDTNCLINDLDSIKHLVEQAPFIVTIPFIVIRELTSMMTRTQKMDCATTAELVLEIGQAKVDRIVSLSQIAKNILDYLQDVFATKRDRIKAITSKGSLVDRIDMIEDVSGTDAYNNDDLVLYACDNLINERNANAPNREQMQRMLTSAGERVANFDEFIYRDVTMVTDDVNLRLKALGFDVPVKKLSQFLKWTRSIVGRGGGNGDNRSK